MPRKRVNLNIQYTDPELKEMYYSGVTLRDIARKCGCSDHKIRTYLINIGVEIKNKNRGKLRYGYMDTPPRIFKEGELDFEEEIKTRIFE